MQILLEQQLEVSAVYKMEKYHRLHNIQLKFLTGPEVVTGSTRMKAGTAQKTGFKYDFNNCNDKNGKGLS